MTADGLPKGRLDRVLDVELLGRCDDDGSDPGDVGLCNLREQMVHGLEVQRADKERRQGRVVCVVLSSLDFD